MKPRDDERYCAKCGEPETTFTRLEWDPYFAEFRCWLCLHHARRETRHKEDDNG